MKEHLTFILLKLCGAPADRATGISRAELAFRHGDALGWIVLPALVLSLLAWWSYRRHATGILPGRRRVLVALRSGLFFLLLLLLLQPLLSFTVETSVRRALVLLIDGSASMKTPDLRQEHEDMERVLIAKGVAKGKIGLGQVRGISFGSDLKQLSRIEIVKMALRNGDIGSYERLQREFDLTAFMFGKELMEIPGEPDTWLDKVDPIAPETALGDAVRDLVMQKRNRPIAGIFLITDGASNTGSDPLEAARMARQEGVRLFIYGVGIAAPPNASTPAPATPKPDTSSDADKPAADAPEPPLEQGETAMNEPLLQQMAELSGGAFFREENLWQLPDTIYAKGERVSTRVDGELWSSPLFLLLLTLVAGTEWTLRKRSQLK